MQKNLKSKSGVARDKKIIENALKKYLSKLKGPKALSNAMKYAVFAGGKRLRPILTLESAKMLKGSVKETLPFACAVELIHNFSLVHDDLPSMDNDNFRRGKPTCHKKFGISTAILAGDGLINLAFGIVAKTKKKKAFKIASILSDAIGPENMVGGQVLDLEYERKSKKNKKLKRKIDNMKTASLMAVSCEVGALSASAKLKDLKKLREFGKNLGMAFQIADDLEDFSYRKDALNKMKKEVGFFISKAKKEIKKFKKNDTLIYIADIVLRKAGIKENVAST